MKGEAAESTEGHQSKKDVKESSSADEEKIEDLAKSKTEGSKSTNNKKAPTEAMIKLALGKRGSYIKANSEYATSFPKLIIIQWFLLHYYTNSL